MTPVRQNSFMSPHECYIAQQYMDLRIQNRSCGRLQRESGLLYQINGDALSDGIGLVYLERVEQIVKKKLALSTSMLRRYTKGCYLPWHRNRWECEHTVLIQISDHSWPIGFAEGQDSPLVEGEQGASSILTASQGDAIIFNGSETYHGRRGLKIPHCTILSIYYVEEGGYLDNRDRRIKYGDNYKSQHNPDSHQWKISAEKQ